MNAAAPLLVAEGLALAAGPRLLVEGLRLAVAPGELWCVIGANGSGKTTLLHTLAGLRAPRAGTLRLAGRPLADWPLAEAACLRGLLPQTLSDAFGASVLEVVLLGRHPHLGRWAWEDEADRALARAALRVVEMEAFEHSDVTTLSGGERQRVGIAALLAQDPLLLLLDEPVAHLDLRHQIAVLAHLRARVDAGRQAALLAIHDVNLARRFATHALVLGGPAGPQAGTVEAVLDAATLGAALGHALHCVQANGRVLFVPA